MARRTLRAKQITGPRHLKGKEVRPEWTLALRRFVQGRSVGGTLISLPGAATVGVLKPAKVRRDKSAEGDLPQPLCEEEEATEGCDRPDGTPTERGWRPEIANACSCDGLAICDNDAVISWPLACRPIVMVSRRRDSHSLARIVIAIACWTVFAAVLPEEHQRDSECVAAATSVVGLSGDSCETQWWSRHVSSGAKTVVHHHGDSVRGPSWLFVAAPVLQLDAIRYLPAQSLLACGTSLRL